MSEPTIITISTQAPYRRRKASISGSALTCRLFSRADFEKGTKGAGDGGDEIWEWCDRAGVYLLAGIHDGKQTVYIGQADSVSERLAEHQRNPAKAFWYATAVLQHAHDQLTAGNIDFLEAKLIHLADRARTAAGFSLKNRVQPRDKNLADRERVESEQLLAQTLILLPAVGFDYFHGPAEKVQPKPAETPAVPAPLCVPPTVEALLERLRDALLAERPDAEFYATRVDYRAKVVRNGHFRPFARLRLGRSAVVLRLKDVGDFKLHPTESVSDSVRQNIQQAYTLAAEHLNNKRAAVTA